MADSNTASSNEEKAEGDKLDSLDNDTIGEGYKAPKRKRFKMTGRQKAASGGIAGLLIGGGIGIFTIIQGPLQFIHIAQLLQQFHFRSGQEAGNSRILKMYKWTKNARAGSAENARLSYLGKKIAVKMDARLAEAGISKNYSDTGLYKNTEIDALKFSENAASGENFKRLPPEEFMAKFEESFGVKLTEVIDPLQPDVPTGKFTADEGGFFSGYFKNRRLNKLIVNEVGQDGVGGSITARIMGKRDAVTWHPIKRLDSKIVGSLDAKFTAWLEELKQRITKGDDVTLSGSGQKDVDPDDSTKQVDNPENDAAASEVNKSGQQAEDALKTGEGSTDGIIKRFTGSTGGRITMTSTAIIGLVCAAQAIAKAVDQIKHDLVILPLIRTGVQAISLGNQVMSGQDISSEQLGFFSKQLYDPETKSSWASAKSIQAELGQEQTGPDIPDEVNIKKLKEGNAFTQFFSSIPGLDWTCNVFNSTAGRIFQFAISLTTPVATIVTTAVMETPQVKDAFAGAIKWLAGSPIPSFVMGATYGNYINYGARLASNNAAAAVGGAKLSDTAAIELRNYNIAALREENRQKPFAKKIFDIHSPHSLASIAIDNSSTDIKATFASILTNVTNPSKFLAIMRLPFSSKISAASNYAYGFDKIGFSLDDLKNSDYDNPYENAEKAKALLASDSGLRDRVHNCFGVTVSENGDTIATDFEKKVDPTDKEYPDDCSDASQNWTRIRFYILDMKTAEATDCYDSGDSQSCQSVGFGGASTGSGASPTTSVIGDIGESSDSINCAPQTIDLGVVESRYTGSFKRTEGPIKIRLCRLTSIAGSGNDTAGNNTNEGAVVNSRAAGALQSLGEKAKTNGLQLTASSSFRLADSCNGTGDGSKCAKPGTSPHQLGVAIDFRGTNVYSASATSCSNRVTDAGNATWDWLFNNAAAFGFKQYSRESWHWDPLNSANRC